MKLHELPVGQKLIIQIVSGENIFEHATEIVKQRKDAICVKPYVYQDKELDLNIEISSPVVCNLYTDDPNDKKRISWKNVELKTEKATSSLVYVIRTSAFNTLSQEDDRRHNERIIVQKKAQLVDMQTEDLTNIIVHDVSDDGISFFAPADFKHSSNQFMILFSDAVADYSFELKINCSIARTVKKAGNLLYGCRLIGDNKDYHMYVFLRKLKANSNYIST